MATMARRQSRGSSTGTYASKVNDARLKLLRISNKFGRDPDSNGLSYWLSTVMVQSGINANNANNAERAWATVVWSFDGGGEFANRVSGPTPSTDRPICA